MGVVTWGSLGRESQAYMSVRPGVFGHVDVRVMVLFWRVFCSPESYERYAD